MYFGKEAFAMREQRVAVVTGAGQGIGEAIVRQLSADGYDVVVADLNGENANKVADDLNKTGHNAVAVEGNVANKADHEKFVQAAVEHFGRLDTYVNNAGIMIVKPVMDINEDDLEKIYKVNVFGDVWGIQAAVAQFKKQDDGDKVRKIINASSVAGHFGDALMAAYGSTKFAVRGLTQVAAQEFGKQHITVNAYCPGIVDTPMWKQIDSDMVKLMGGQPGDYWKKFSSSISVGKPETPQEVADFVSYLASPKADYMNGQAVQIDGGMRMI